MSNNEGQQEAEDAQNIFPANVGYVDWPIPARQRYYKSHTRVMCCLLLFPIFLNVIYLPQVISYEIDCSLLRMGQYICPDPAYDQIDPKTQQFYGCTRENKAKVLCKAADGIICLETKNSTFRREMPCKWTNGYSFETALLLSVFLGMFGIDRFYLGYPGIGLLKLCTLGFMFIGQLIDIILIATQIVGPADGSYYVIPYYGPGIQIIRSDNSTYRLPQKNW